MIPSGLEHVQKIARSGERLAVFLDYDGTLTPIVSHPEDAWLSESMRQTLRSLAARLPVAILSGRDLDDVRGRVHVDGIVYAGSHGFDIAGAGGVRRELGAAYLPVLDAAEAELREALDEIPGAQLERKHFSVAAHYRNVDESDASEPKPFRAQFERASATESATLSASTISMRCIDSLLRRSDSNCASAMPFTPEPVPMSKMRNGLLSLGKTL